MTQPLFEATCFDYANLVLLTCQILLVAVRSFCSFVWSKLGGGVITVPPPFKYSFWTYFDIDASVMKTEATLYFVYKTCVYISRI